MSLEPEMRSEYGSEEIDLRRYFDIARRWYKLILGCAVLGALAAFLLGWLETPDYVAQASLTILRSGSVINFDPKIRTVSDADPTAGVDAAARRKALVTIGGSDDLAKAVYQRISSQLKYKYEDLTAVQRTVEVKNDGDLLNISATARNPEDAALIANTWAEVYQDRVNQIYGEQPVAVSSVQDQVASAKNAYESAQSALVAYLADNPVERLSRQKTLLTRQLDDAVELEARLDRLLSDARALRERLAAGTPSNSRGDELAALLLESSAFGGAASLPVGLQIPIDQLGTGATPDQQLKTVEALIDVVQNRRTALASGTTDKLSGDLNAVQSQLEKATAQKTELTASRDLAWSTFQTLSAKLAEANVSADSPGSYIRLVNAAVAPTLPISSRRPVKAGLGALVGLLLGLVIAFVLDLTDDRLTNSHVVAGLGLPVLGTVPPNVAVATAATGKAGELPEPAAEAFRRLRHYVISPPSTAGDSENLPHIIAITSPGPAEGKSTVALALAHALVRSGKRVALVDANLRHPTLESWLHLTARHGLSDWLRASASDGAFPKLEASAQDQSLELGDLGARVEGLTVIPAGAPTSDPTALLEHPALAQFLAQLRAAFDLVILDTAPVLETADALAVARQSDAVILVANSVSATQQEVARARADLEASGTHILGIVLTHIKLKSAPSGVRSKSRADTGTPGGDWWMGVRDRLAELVGPSSS